MQNISTRATLLVLLFALVCFFVSTIVYWNLSASKPYSNKAVTQGRSRALLSGTQDASPGSTAPAGMISHFAAKCASQGWLPCDGSAVSRTTYSLLFAAIGTTYGPGDGSTTFTVPDLRGVFIRSFDYTLSSEKSRTQVDPDTRKLGLLQPDAFQTHTHDGTLNLKATNGPGSGNNLTFVQAWGDQRAGGVVDSAYSTVEIKGPNSGKSNAAETRPINLAMYACISTGGQ